MFRKKKGIQKAAQAKQVLVSLYDDLEDDPFAPLEGYNNEHIGKLVADAKSDGSDDDSSSDSDSHGDSDSDSEGEGDGANRSKNKAKTRKSYTFAEMVKRATELEKEGQLKFAAHYYLYCLQHYRETQAEGEKSKHGADGEGENGAGSITLIGYCLNRLSSICYKNKKFKEALQFQQAERMLYESNLLAIDTVDKGSQDAADSKEGSNSNGTEEEDGGEGAGEGMFKKVGITSVDPFAVSVDQDTCPKSMAEQEAHALQYERLGRIFMKEGNVELAKSYALKAIKIRQDIKNRWGDLNNITANQQLLEELASSGRQKYQETLNLYHGKPSSDSASKAKLKSKLGTAGVKEGAAVTSREKGRKERERRAFDEREGADTDDDVDEGIENILDQLGVRKRKSSPKDSEEKKNKKEKSHTKSNSNNIKGRRGQKKEEDVDEEKYEGPESSPSSSSSSVVCNGSTLAIVSSTVAVVALIGSYFMTQL